MAKLFGVSSSPYYTPVAKPPRIRNRKIFTSGYVSKLFEVSKTPLVFYPILGFYKDCYIYGPEPADDRSIESMIEDHLLE
jgi:hypothetical protein